MKNALLFSAATVAITICSIFAETKTTSSDSPPADAITGATGDKAHILAMKKEHAVTKAYDALKAAGPYFLATVEKNNVPRVRPVGIVEMTDGKIWFHVGKHKSSYKQIQKNPHVEIATIGKTGKFLRLSGIAVCKDNTQLDKKVFKEYPKLKNIYNEKTGYTLGHFYINKGVVEFPTDSGTEIITF